jgi:hypothetical protein
MGLQCYIPNMLRPLLCCSPNMWSLPGQGQGLEQGPKQSWSLRPEIHVCSTARGALGLSDSHTDQISRMQMISKYSLGSARSQFFEDYRPLRCFRGHLLLSWPKMSFGRSARDMLSAPVSSLKAFRHIYDDISSPLQGATRYFSNAILSQCQ